MNNLHLIIILILIIYIIFFFKNKINNNIFKLFLLLLIIIFNNPTLSIFVSIAYIINIVNIKENFCGCLCGSVMTPQETEPKIETSSYNYNIL